MKFEFGESPETPTLGLSDMTFQLPMLFLIHFIIACSGWSIAAEPKCGMWVYKTKAIVSSQVEQAQLFAFCQERQITDLFWQVHFDKMLIGSAKLEAGIADALFLKAAHAHKLRLHALMGDPSHTLSAKHERVLACVDALISYNEKNTPEARFDGLHLDIEPHGLAEWKKADLFAKCRLITQFVEVHAKVAKRMDAAAAGLVFGTDIVFWLDKLNAEGTPMYPILHGGVIQDPVKHLFGIVDHVAIMSYRGTVEGRNGSIALVERTIDHADVTSAEVFVGVKMAKIGPAMESYFGRTEAEMQADLQRVESVYRPHASYAGIAYFMHEAFKVMPQRAPAGSSRRIDTDS